MIFSISHFIGFHSIYFVRITLRNFHQNFSCNTKCAVCNVHVQHVDVSGDSHRGSTENLYAITIQIYAYILLKRFGTA